MICEQYLAFMNERKEENLFDWGAPTSKWTQTCKTFGKQSSLKRAKKTSKGNIQHWTCPS